MSDDPDFVKGLAALNHMVCGPPEPETEECEGCERLRVELAAAKTFAGLLLLSTNEAYAYAIKNGFDCRGKFIGHTELGIKLRETLAPTTEGGTMAEMRAMAEKALAELLEASDE